MAGYRVKHTPINTVLLDLKSVSVYQNSTSLPYVSFGYGIVFFIYNKVNVCEYTKEGKIFSPCKKINPISTLLHHKISDLSHGVSQKKIRRSIFTQLNRYLSVRQTVSNSAQ